MMRRIAKTSIQAVLPSRHPPILVASMGRSGSTLVHDAICQAMARERFGRSSGLAQRIVSDHAWRLGGRRLHRGVVYKTHALADELKPGVNVRVVFLYRRPSDVALSVLRCRERYGQEWITSHLDHLRATGPLEELEQADVLRMEEQIDGWLNHSPAPVLALRYEELWASLGVLRAYLALDVQLPPKHLSSRPDDVADLKQRRIRDAYSWLDERVEALPGHVLVSPLSERGLRG